MRLPNLSFAVLVAAILVSASAISAGGRVDLDSSGPDASAAKPFIGRWDLTLKAADRDYPSWLEIRLEDGKLVAQMVGRWGNAHPLPKVEISDGQLSFVSPKAEEETPDDWVFVGKRDGKNLSGSVTGPKGGPWKWSGMTAPLLQGKGTPKWGKPVSLFNGKDLTGWKMSDPNAAAVWKVENGTLISPGHGPELINDQKFQDFKLHVEFNCGANANSGVVCAGPIRSAD
jgi:hypothetical protein